MHVIMAFDTGYNVWYVERHNEVHLQHAVYILRWNKTFASDN